MDSDLRSLERAARDGDEQDRVRYFAAVSRAGAWPRLHADLQMALENDAIARGGKRNKITGEVFVPATTNTLSRWRSAARPVVEFVLAHTKGWPEKEIKKALRDAYPFGPRENYPYKIWLDEVARQRGKRRSQRRMKDKNGVYIHYFPGAEPDEPTRSMFA